MSLGSLRGWAGAAAFALMAVVALAPVPRPAAAQEGADPAIEARVAARALPDGRVEVALQARTSPDGAWSERISPGARFLPADAAPGRWLWTAPAPLENLEWRVTARRLSDGRVEVALQARAAADGAWSERLLPEHRFLPAGLEAGRWLLSSPVEPVPEPPQIVAFYGHPDVRAMGVLGHGTPAEVATRVSAWAERYDELNGPRSAVGAYHLIVAVAQTWPTPEGDWLRHLEHERIAVYVEAAREHGLLLFLDTQIGWSDPLSEVGLLEPFLREPFVHVAIDPEFATEHLGVAPGLAIGSVTAQQVNEVQRYLAGIVREESLPPKILMVHQFTDWMLLDRDEVEQHPEVELSIDMDGFGLAPIKVDGYERWALTAPSERPAFKLFFDLDTPVMTPEEVQGLDQPPDIVIYQ